MRKTYVGCAVSALLSFSLVSQAAVYEVEVIDTASMAQNAFAQTIDEQGNVVVSLTEIYNQPIDFALLNQLGVTNLTDPEAVLTGNINAADYNNIIQTIRAQTTTNSAVAQRLGRFRSFYFDSFEFTEVAGFDESTFDPSVLSNSTDTIVRDSLNGNYFIGSGEDVFRTTTLVNAEGAVFRYSINDFRERAFVQVDGVTMPLLSPDLTLNGRSIARAINNNLQIVGESMIGVTALLESEIGFCNNPGITSEIEQPICLWREQYSTDNSSKLTSNGFTRATVWEIAPDGEVVNTTTYGLLFEPEPDSPFNYTSRATDINDAGIAVGESNTGEIVAITGQRPQAGLVAVAFENNQVIELLDRDEYGQSSALAINNNAWVAGVSAQETNGSFANKLFVKNMTSNDDRLIEGFFSSSVMVPRAINNNNIVVGEADAEASARSLRERHAFLYNINSDEFVNLNDLISCDSPYTLISATAINDNNEISVTARASLPVKLPNGFELFDERGEPVLDDATVALKLTPIQNGEIESCGTSGNGNGGSPLLTTDRQGATTSGIVLIFLAGVIAIRRQVRFLTR